MTTERTFFATDYTVFTSLFEDFKGVRLSVSLDALDHNQLNFLWRLDNVFGTKVVLRKQSFRLEDLVDYLSEHDPSRPRFQAIKADIEDASVQVLKKLVTWKSVGFIKEKTKEEN